MNVRLRMNKHCYSDLGTIYVKGLCLGFFEEVMQTWIKNEQNSLLLFAVSQIVSSENKNTYSTLNKVTQF